MKRRALFFAVPSALAAGLLGTSAFAAPAVSMTLPQEVAPATPVPDVVTVRAIVTDAQFLVSTVNATIGTVSAALSKSCPGNPANCWQGTLDISALPMGPSTLTFEATNANGETTTLAKNVVHSQQPTLVTNVVDESVASPSLAVSLACTKTDPTYPCAKVEVKVDATVLATGASLNQSVSLAAWEGKAIDVLLIATDTAGLRTLRSVPVFVESSPNLVRVGEAAGHLLDFDATRLLYTTAAGIAIQDRATGNVTALSSETPAEAYLFDGGAAWRTGTWKNGAFSVAPARTMVAGGFALRTGATAKQIVRENIALGTEDVIACNLPTPGDTCNRHVIDDKGNIAYTAATTVHVIAAGTTVDGTSYARDNREPIVSGLLVVSKQNLTSGRVPIYLGATALDTAVRPGDPVTTPLLDYRAASPWVAYTKYAAGGYEVWTTDGTNNRLATPYVNAKLAGVNANGDVVVDHASGRAIGSAGAAAPNPTLAIGGKNGTMKFFDGAWYEMKGRALLKVVPNGGGPGGDAGADGGGDAGTPDAGVDGAPSNDGGASGSSSGASGSNGGSSASSTSSGASGSTSGGTPEGAGGGDDGGCAVSDRPTGFVEAWGAVVATALALRMRRRRKPAAK